MDEAPVVGGMGRGVHGPQLGDGNTSVDLGGLEFGVAEHLCEVTNVGATAAEHQRRDGVPEQVTAAVLG